VRGNNSTNEIAYQDGVYRTPRRTVSLLARMFPTLVCHSKAITHIVQLSSAAKSPRYSRKDLIRQSLGVMRALESVGVSVEISGIDHVRTVDWPCVFASNHMSAFETLVLPGIIAPFGEVTFVVKESLTRYPVFRHIMHAMNSIPVGRENPRDDLRAVLTGGKGRLGAGVSIVLFPESVRVAEFDPKRFNTIATKLARDANVPVIPLALKTDAWGVGRLVSDFGKVDLSKKVHFAFGAPLRVKDRGTEEHREVVSFIAGKLREWGSEASRS
jgi:1-acyl-sn-glycerol-3-phosphate acyltransferase